ncbi:MAG: hypothetical protein WA085_10095 [Sphingobium sp.]|uniref:hypothetical protein n=1 Tax=Sphingobium sp. CECT 9361 TaxID=2845384 RepID=UPI001E5331D4|nr:hypothetical protein [Sphingobium sp. CECT 9361]CAH0356471.1 hypothetical protein SPH9361_04113 [Sphingobium sp. CECT 9361]
MSLNSALTVGVRLCLLGLMGIALLVAVQLARQEGQLASVERQVGSQWRTDTLGTLPKLATASPRLCLVLALSKAKAATMEQDYPSRRAHLALANALVERAINARPAWGEAWVVKTYILFLEYGPNDPATLNAYAASLKSAPYLRDSAYWRIRFGAVHWNKLDRTTRERVLNEAQWTANIARSDAMRVTRLLGTSGAANAFNLRKPALRDFSR